MSEPGEREGDAPPFASWRALYTLVIAALIAIIVLLAWLTRALS